jgi:hypothetical protein
MAGCCVVVVVVVVMVVVVVEVVVVVVVVVVSLMLTSHRGAPRTPTRYAPANAEFTTAGTLTIVAGGGGGLWINADARWWPTAPALPTAGGAPDFSGCDEGCAAYVMVGSRLLQGAIAFVFTFVTLWFMQWAQAERWRRRRRVVWRRTDTFCVGGRGRPTR